MDEGTVKPASKGMNLEKGVILALVVILTPLLIFFYLLVPALILRWTGVDGVAIWRTWLADPVLKLAFQLLLFFEGEALPVIAVLAFLKLATAWLLIKTWGLLMRWVVGDVAEVRRMAVPGRQDFSEDYDRLRSQLGDDLERLILHSSQWKRETLKVTPPKIKHLNERGCLVRLLTPVYYLVFLLVVLAIYDALVKLYGEPTLPAGTLALASQLGFDPAAFSGMSTTWAGIDLTQRSLPLTLLIILPEFLYWLSTNFSVTGWTLPRPVDGWTWIIFAFGLVLCFFFLDGAILLAILVMKLAFLLSRILNLLVFDHLRLWISVRSLKKKLAKTS
jgi:hypothetical protein